MTQVEKYKETFEIMLPPLIRFLEMEQSLEQWSGSCMRGKEPAIQKRKRKAIQKHPNTDSASPRR